MASFPNIADLANASETRVLLLWQGLGYYSRARNLHTTAKIVHNEYQDKFPTTYAELLKLKGIGPYTAAAIASICFDEQTPVVDGNVYRFASRYFGIETDIATSGARKIFTEILATHIPAESPGNFNQALMEHGSMVCAPSPVCEKCDFISSCYAYSKKLQKSLPIKSKKLKVRKRYFNYLVISHDEKMYLKVRKANDVWHGLYDFYLIEGKHTEEEVLTMASAALKSTHFLISEISGEVLHVLSHQRIIARFYTLSVSKALSSSVMQNLRIDKFSTEEILNLPKPKLIVNYLEARGIK